MDLTWVAATSFLLVGVGYVVVQTADRFRVVCWALLCASLFALSTRDLFRTRERGPPATTASGEPTNRSDESATRADESADRPTARTGAADERDRPPLAARIRGRVARWLG
jgi:hypothetical protein